GRNLEHTHAQPVPGRSNGRAIGLMAGGVSVPNSDHRGRPDGVETHQVRCLWNYPPLLVHDCHVDHCAILAVGGELAAVRTDAEGCGGASGLATISSHEASLRITPDLD